GPDSEQHRDPAWMQRPAAQRQPIDPPLLGRAHPRHSRMPRPRAPCQTTGVFDRVLLRASDRAASERFYATVLAVLRIDAVHHDGGTVTWDDFALGQATTAHPATHRLHIGFVAPSRQAVDAFWEAGRAAGHPDDGRPGPRPVYGRDYYGGFLLDPDGNSAEAVHHGTLRTGGAI